MQDLQELLSEQKVDQSAYTHPCDRDSGLTIYATTKTPPSLATAIATHTSKRPRRSTLDKLQTKSRRNSNEKNKTPLKRPDTLTIHIKRCTGQLIGVRIASQGNDGVVITSLDPKGAASKSVHPGEIAVGDTILSIDGEDIGSADHARAAYLLASAGRNTTLKIKCNHKEATKSNSDTLDKLTHTTPQDELTTRPMGLEPHTDVEAFCCEFDKALASSFHKYQQEAEDFTNLVTAFDTAVSLEVHSRRNYPVRQSGMFKVNHRFSYACNLASKTLWDYQIGSSASPISDL
eukprot:m.102602 g.102602  ORF g.102602 m.102602 type:complete len:290 (+) comp13776_c1_seq1:1030-1899(+)